MLRMYTTLVVHTENKRHIASTEAMLCRFLHKNDAIFALLFILPMLLLGHWGDIVQLLLTFLQLSSLFAFPAFLMHSLYLDWELTYSNRRLVRFTNLFLIYKNGRLITASQVDYSLVLWELKYTKGGNQP